MILEVFERCLAANEAEGLLATGKGVECCLEGRLDEAGDVLLDLKGDQKVEKIDRVVDVLDKVDSLSILFLGVPPLDSRDILFISDIKSLLNIVSFSLLGEVIKISYGLVIDLLSLLMDVELLEKDSFHSLQP